MIEIGTIANLTFVYRRRSTGNAPYGCDAGVGLKSLRRSHAEIKTSVARILRPVIMSGLACVGVATESGMGGNVL